MGRYLHEEPSLIGLLIGAALKIIIWGTAIGIVFGIAFKVAAYIGGW